MASSLGVGSSHAEHFYKEEIQVPSMEHFQKILDSVELDLGDFADGMAYQGFDKSKIALLAARRLGGLRTVKFCLLGGMRGTNLEKIMARSKRVDEDVKEAWRTQKIKAGGTGPEDLTMGRLMATFPEITGHYLLKHNVPKKIQGDACPACLQFPAAAGLPMSHNVRLLHLEFSIRFSFLISKDKKFHPQYYRAAFTGQQEVERLSGPLQDQCGNPTNQLSKAFDFDAAMSAMKAKYGEENFDESSMKP
jgi:hypothetical protein